MKHSLTQLLIGKQNHWSRSNRSNSNRIFREIQEQFVHNGRYVQSFPVEEVSLESDKKSAQFVVIIKKIFAQFTLVVDFLHKPLKFKQLVPTFMIEAFHRE